MMFRLCIGDGGAGRVTPWTSDSFRALGIVKSGRQLASLEEDVKLHLKLPTWLSRRRHKLTSEVIVG